jgi:hypothetical protein
MSYVKLKSVFLAFLERWFSLGARDFDALMERLRYVQSGRAFTRDDMNER